MNGKKENISLKEEIIVIGDKNVKFMKQFKFSKIYAKCTKLSEIRKEIYEVLTKELFLTDRNDHEHADTDKKTEKINDRNINKINNKNMDFEEKKRIKYEENTSLYDYAQKDLDLSWINQINNKRKPKPILVFKDKEDYEQKNSPKSK